MLKRELFLKPESGGLFGGGVIGAKLSPGADVEFDVCAIGSDEAGVETPYR
jgi:hypothetical protein